MQSRFKWMIRQEWFAVSCGCRPSQFCIGTWKFSLMAGWSSLIPALALAGGASYVAYRAIKPRNRPNLRMQQEEARNIINADDLGKKTAFCRCWKSKKFPYCDGSHKTHNKETGENIGPLVIIKEEK